MDVTFDRRAMLSGYGITIPLRLFPPLPLTFVLSPSRGEAEPRRMRCTFRVKWSASASVFCE
jgi:hypothetical protein